MLVEMRTKKRQFGGLLRWFVVAVIGLVVVVQATLIPTVQAASISSINDLTQKTRIYNEYMMLANNKCVWSDTPNVNQPSWFSVNADVGLIVETQDGTIECSSAGWLTEIIRTATGGSDYQTIYNAVGHDRYADKSSTLASYLSKDLFAAANNSQTTGGLSQSDIDAMRYQSLIFSFTSSNGCNAVQKNLTPAQSNGTNETTITIPYVDATGKLTNTNFTYPNASLGKSVPVGYSVTSDGVYECREIAQALSNTLYAKDAAAWFAAQPGRTVGTGALTSSSNRQTCENASGLKLAWVVCPIIELMDDIIAGLDTAIQNLLIIDEAQYNSPPIQQVAKTMRYIALALIVPLMVLMAIGTALDIGPFDAYSVKKMFPRLAFSVLAIALSNPFGVFMIELSNAASSGILGLISAAFGYNTTGGNMVTLSSLLSINGGAGTLGSLALGIGASAAVGALTFGILGSLALVAAVGLFIGFIVLTLWQIVVIFGVILLPIHWFLWCLGGVTGVGDKVDNLLWGGWLGALVFGFSLNTVIGVGTGFAFVVANSPTTNFGAGMLTTATIIVTKVGGYLLIKQIAAGSGAALATVSGVVNDRGKGFFDRQSKYRQNKRSTEMAKWRTGQRGGAMSRKVGEGFGTFLDSDQKGKLASSYLRGSRGAAERQEAIAVQRKMNQARWAQTDRAKATKDNDAMLRAGTYLTASEARRGLRQDWGMTDNAAIEAAVAAQTINGGFSQDRANYATRALAATGTGYNSLEQLHRTVARVAQSDSEAADLFGEINAVTKGVGRHDLAAGYGVHKQMFTNSGGVGGYRMGAQFLSDEDERAGYVQAFKDVDGVTFMRDKKVGVENMSSAVAQTFRDTQTRAQAGDLAAREELARLSGHIGKAEQSFGYASSTNSESAGNILTQPTSGEESLRQIIGPNGSPIWVADRGRLRVAQDSARTRTQVNEVTGQVETILRSTGPSGGGGGGGGFILDPNTGRPVPFDNPTRSNPVRPAPPGVEAAGQAYDRNKPQSATNPYDPNRPA